MTRKLIGMLFLLAGALPIASSTLLAQVDRATILGTIEDATGSVLPGVTVRVTNVETGISRTQYTDERGNYRAPQLALGTYEVKAELSGFTTAVRAGISLTIGQEAVVNFRLGIGGVTDTVTVTAEAVTVQSQTSEMAGLVDDRQIRTLPLNGRDLTQLVFLQTGVVAQRFALQSPNTGQGARISSGGARMNYNNFLVDGTRKNEFGASTPGSVAGVQLGVDAIREFRVLTHNYNAEFGQTAGAIITAVTKSGSNEFRGGGFYFHRNEAFDARNFFDVPTEPQPDFKRHQYGFSLGGPILRNRTFFFGAYERFRERRGVTQTDFVPTQAARDGLLRDPRTGAALTVDPRVGPYLALYPFPNGADLGDGSGVFFYPFIAPKNEHFFTIRADHQFSDRFSIFGRYQLSKADRRDARGAGIFEDVTASKQQLVTIQGTQILSSRLVNTFVLGFNGARPTLNSVATVPIDPSLAAAPDRQIPRITISGVEGGAAGSAGGAISEIGPRNLDGGRWTTTSYQIKNDLNYSRGAHAFKVGGSFEALRFHVVQADLNGSMSFASLADFLRARPRSFSITADPGQEERLWLQKIIGLYAHDDFKVMPRLTLNLGLRWEMATAHRDKEGRNSVLLDQLDPQVSVVDEMYEPGKKNFQPRVGFAWDMAGDGKSSLRGGFGIFHNLFVGRADGLGLTRNPPFSSAVSRRNPSFEPVIAFREAQAAGLPQVEGYPRHLSVPAMYHYNLTFEKELVGKTVARVGYAGSVGRHLQTDRSGNTALPTTLPDGTKFVPEGSASRNPNFSRITWRNADGNSTYHALETSLTRRVSAGLHFQLSYTLADAIDDQSSTAGADNRQDRGRLLDPDDRKSDRGRSINDVRQNLVANVSYQVPVGRERALNPGGLVGALFGDWTINGIFTAASGVPFTAQVGFNRARNQDDQAPDRPDLVPGSSDNPVLGTPTLWFDPLAFQLPVAGTFGNVARNTIEGAGVAVLDLGLIKQVRVRGGMLELRAEAFNLLNRANFGLPQRSLFNPDGTRIANAGRITETVTTGREMQFGVKLVF